MLELIKPGNKKNNNKDMNGTMLLHPAHHPKDISRNKLQTMFNATCKARFQNLLKIDKKMIAYHNPNNLRNIIIPSSLKQREGINNSANCHANKAGIKMMAEDTDISKRANEIITNERITPQRIIITNNQLMSSGI